MPFFEEEMPELMLGGLELPCSSRKLGGGRATVDRRYPNRNGQSSEDMGREPYTFEIEIPLFADVDPDHYPGLWDRLRNVLDTGGVTEFQDHELGRMNVSWKGYTADLDAAKQDGVIVRVTLTEDELDIAFAFREQLTVPNAEDTGAALDVAIEEAGLDEDTLVNNMGAAGVGLDEDEMDFEAGELFATMVDRFSERLDDGVQTGQQIAATVDTMSGRMDVVIGLVEADPENAEVMTAAMQLAAAVTDMGDRAFRDAVPIVQETLSVETSIFDLALRLYGDEQRAAEIMLRNPTINPLFIPSGTVIDLAAA